MRPDAPLRRAVRGGHLDEPLPGDRRATDADSLAARSLRGERLTNGIAAVPQKSIFNSVGPDRDRPR
jgi:hypothetical protein